MVPSVQRSEAVPPGPATRRDGRSSDLRKPPLVVLGGAAGGLSVARSVSRLGVRVYVIHKPGSSVRYSRFCRSISVPPGENLGAAWAEYLLGTPSDHLRGAVLLAAGDLGIEVIVRYREALSGKYILDDSNSDAQLCMLDKLRSYRAAREAGVPVPCFWSADSREELDALRDDLIYPLIVKPRVPEVFASGERRRVSVVGGWDELQAAFAAYRRDGLDVVLMEMVPGPDDLLCSYYTYLDGRGEPIFDFTKRVVRRYPKLSGNGCCHVTDRNDELKELALGLLSHVGLRGLAAVEFKRDLRDGRLKLIECNARFTAANCLLTKAGLDLGQFVYRRLAGIEQEPLGDYRSGLVLWSPVDDLRAFAELRRDGELRLVDWLRSIGRPSALPLFRWSDPLPSVVDELQRARRLTRKLVRRR